MRYVDLKIPPGVYRNGTEYQSAGRWYDASLVRWENGEMKPVGGWQQKGSTTLTGSARGLLSWRGNQAGVYTAVGTTGSATELRVIKSDNTFVNITPSGVRDQPSDASNAGYGWLDYGSGTYGTARDVSGQYTFAKTWSLDTFGQYLVACLDGDGRIYEWQLGSSTPAAVLANAPTECVGLVVTEERFVFALGADGDDRKVAWCDQQDNTTWAAASTNQAGSVRLESNGPIMQGIRARGQTIILTTTDVYTATYIGAPLVYAFERVGSSNGVVSRRAAAASDSFVAWMGPRGFWVYDGYVREIPCEVEDYVFSDINDNQISLVHAWVNSQHNEIWWHYPSSTATDCDRYVCWNYGENHWSVGEMDQLAAIDRGVLRYPLGVDASGVVYEREVTGAAHGTSTPFATSGPLEVGGGQNAYLTRMIADEKTQGDVSVSVLTRQYPNGPETTRGPYSLKDPVSMRASARQLKLKVEESQVGDWRWGTPRVAIVPGGHR